ncbi:aromatic-ring-hydroxylating dioxygenase subunit beta [Xanthobacter oligotrophicus]|uniref:aromatic-ring-hydroxylating dioxygenase subunit beta n=1 Tax=Xanthobacter oligotrophicus TaxID=2607286 RepID=UPI0011F0EE1A|nr:aromatic-ring-hydroxylating dioxygenase subunit beta [Xanthobacter oligotrophicus]MCG5236588.1 aromatic-ring-hydroxylating dioxygenase subunit beta [Xanthobacter oligotrophicus]
MNTMELNRPLTPATVSRSDVEEFLFLEADLIDTWQLPAWLELFTDDGVYYVPSTDVDADASPDNNLFYVADDHFRLGERVKRLMKRTAHAEFPRSRLRHLVSNVRVTGRSEDELRVSCAFITYRSKDGITDSYVGTGLYRLAVRDGQLRIKEKRSILSSDGLRPQGRVSFIL